MSSRGLIVRLHVKHGAEQKADQILHSALSTIQNEPGTSAWFAVRFGRGEYGVVGFFEDDAGRDEHQAGPALATLRQLTDDVLESAPRMQKFDVVAEKLPVLSADPDTRGLLLSFKAKSGRAREVEDFFQYAHEQVHNERTTSAWFAMRMEDGEYGMFGVFPDKEDRFLHLVGQVPRELAKQSFKILGSMPDLEMVNVHAERIGADIHEIVHH